LDWLDNYSVVEACQDYTVTNNYNGTIPNLCNGGPITVTWTVVDGCGASSTASAEIIVTPDTTPPTFVNCPTNMTVNADVDLCAANVIYSTPVATDCNLPATVAFTSGIASGQTFPLGTTTIVFTATDNCGNTNTCSFTITVVDSAIPSIACPSNAVEVCADNAVYVVKHGSDQPDWRRELPRIQRCLHDLRCNDRQWHRQHSIRHQLRIRHQHDHLYDHREPMAKRLQL
jgi:hypothetical protein